MTTKNTTSGSNSTSFQFAPGSVDMWTQNMRQWLPFAQGLYKNPFNNEMFNQENAIGQDQAANFGQRNKSNVLANANALGYGTNSGLINSMFQRAGLDTGMLQAQAFRGAVGNANQRAMTGLGISSAFQPLMTGTKGTFNQQQTTSGLGTWLPQLAGAAIGAGTAFATGGASAAAGAGGAGTAAAKGVSGMGSGMSSMFGGIGTAFGGGGYGYGSGSSFQPNGAFVNPYMFGGASN